MSDLPKAAQPDPLKVGDWVWIAHCRAAQRIAYLHDDGFITNGCSCGRQKHSRHFETEGETWRRLRHPTPADLRVGLKLMRVADVPNNLFNKAWPIGEARAVIKHDNEWAVVDGGWKILSSLACFVIIPDNDSGSRAVAILSSAEPAISGGAAHIGGGVFEGDRIVRVTSVPESAPAPSRTPAVSPVPYCAHQQAEEAEILRRMRDQDRTIMRPGPHPFIVAARAGGAAWLREKTGKVVA